jgi:hypothetical protein
MSLISFLLSGISADNISQLDYASYAFFVGGANSCFVQIGNIHFPCFVLSSIIVICSGLLMKILDSLLFYEYTLTSMIKSEVERERN